MNIKNTCVIGAGIMGAGIAQIIAMHDYNVNLVDLNEEILQKAKESIRINLEKFYVAKNKLTPEKANAVLERINLKTNKHQAIEDVQVVIEAVFEDLKLKQDLFAELDEICEKSVILASNTSSLSISQIASKSKHQERIIGIHFFNPAPVMKLIELIRGKNTSEKVIRLSKEFSESLGKTVVLVNDSPGFITTRLIYVLCNEAIKLRSEGIASTEDIDTAVKLAFNFPMGPLELSDLVGNDIYLHVGEYLHEELGDCYQPSSLLKEMVNKNQLGRKTKKGFYEY
ncbi:MAG: 3-hydroxyacyl-CoA dehydrogenase family protein [Promethearchaeota archaeon]